MTEVWPVQRSSQTDTVEGRSSSRAGTTERESPSPPRAPPEGSRSFSQRMEEATRINDELQKTNEEMRRTMYRQQQRTIRVLSQDLSSRDNPQPFSRKIMDEPIPLHFLTPKITPF